MNSSKDIVSNQIYYSTPELCSSNPRNASLFYPNDHSGASEIRSPYLLQESESLNKTLETTDDIFQDLEEINDPTALLQDTTSIDALKKLSGRDEFVLHETRRGESSVSERKVDDTCQAKLQKRKREEVAQNLIENKKPKRTRSAEIHNISEKRRRDRIRKKVRALQQLIPCCYKPDRASILDDAIQYLKELQHQVKVMSSMRANATTADISAPSVGIDSGNSRQIPHFSPLLPRPTPMEMAAMCHPTALHVRTPLPSPAYGYMINTFPSIQIMPPCGNLLPQLQQHAPIPNNDLLFPTFPTTSAGFPVTTTTASTATTSTAM